MTNLDNNLKAQHTGMVNVVNANSDTIFREIQSYKDILNGIKANTRPRRAE